MQPIWEWDELYRQWIIIAYSYTVSSTQSYSWTVADVMRAEDV
jgi:hypothetical protein